MGIRHIRNIIALGHTALAFDSDPLREEIARDIGAILSVDRLDALVLATPPHVRSRATLPCLYEKPLGMTTRDAERVVSPLTQVGYNLRFDQPLLHFRGALPEIGRPLTARVEFGQGLEQWRPGTPPAETPYAATGILLEASHELDLIRWLFGEWATVIATTKHDLFLVAEDTVAAIITMQSGLVVELHLDMTRPGYRRRIEVVGERGVMEWSFDPSRAEQTYRDEMVAFLAAVESKTPDAIAAGYEDGVAAVNMADAIRASAASGFPADWCAT